MTTTQQNSPARRWYNTTAALRAGKINVDEARAQLAMLRIEIGADAYEQAKRIAMANATRIGL